METIEHDDRTIVFRVADRGADGPTCVFVHGSGGDRRVWKAQERLARRLRIVSLDLSGHGRSDDIDTPPGRATLQAYAADVAAVYQHVDGTVLVGNSMGGAIVQHLLVEHVLDVDAAVLVGTGAKLAVHPDIREYLSTDFDRAVAYLHEPGRLFATADDALVDASREAMYACGRAVTERDYLSCHTFDLRDRLNEVDRPVLAICGVEDGLTPPRYHTYLANAIEDGVYAEIEDAAHMVMLERPDAFNRRLESFLTWVST